MTSPLTSLSTASTAATSAGRTRLVHTRDDLRAAVAQLMRVSSGPEHRPEVGVVMSLGALHDGHRSLIKAARARCQVVVVTVFLNPLQFGPHEDLSRYPVTLEADVALCSEEGVDLVFAPPVEQMYPEGTPRVRVSAGHVGDVLEGASRPGHFDGVLTVVAKLLHITSPDVTFFGAKDAQQVLLVRTMVADIDFPTEVVTIPTMRAPDGLALSSRNVYLSAEDRVAALALSRGLRAGAEQTSEGPIAVRRAAEAVLSAEPGLTVDYLVLVDPSTLADIGDGFTGDALLAVAARVGSTRLIDNIGVTIPERPGPA